MTLEDWGWTPFFADQFQPWSPKGYLPARVIRGEKNYFRVWSQDGELTVRFAGKMRHRVGPICRWSATGSSSNRNRNSAA